MSNLSGDHSIARSAYTRSNRFRKPLLTSYGKETRRIQYHNSSRSSLRMIPGLGFTALSPQHHESDRGPRERSRASLGPAFQRDDHRFSTRSNSSSSWAQFIPRLCTPTPSHPLSSESLKLRSTVPLQLSLLPAAGHCTAVLQSTPGLMGFIYTGCWFIHAGRGAKTFRGRGGDHRVR